MTTGEKANAFHDRGFNCCQSTLACLCEYTGLEEETALAIGGGFGGGLRCGESCGALCGAVMALGLRYRYSREEDDEAKSEISCKTREFGAEFERRFGARRCLDLVKCDISSPELMQAAKERGDMEICHEIITFAAEKAEEMIKEL